MSFESLVIAFSERFLSDRTVDLIVAPALADLQFEQFGGRRRKTANRMAVLRAVAGGLRDEVKRDLGTFVALMLLPAGYYLFFLTICLDFFSDSIGSFTVATAILILSLGPVMVCFWPERRTARPVD